MSNENQLFLAITAISANYYFCLVLCSPIFFETFSFKMKENVSNCDLYKSFFF